MLVWPLNEHMKDDEQMIMCSNEISSAGLSQGSVGDECCVRVCEGTLAVEFMGSMASFQPESPATAQQMIMRPIF
jgi:hypothetical protein